MQRDLQAEQRIFEGGYSWSRTSIMMKRSLGKMEYCCHASSIMYHDEEENMHVSTLISARGREAECCQ